jgi:hypothetical protein
MRSQDACCVCSLHPAADIEKYYPEIHMGKRKMEIFATFGEKKHKKKT